MVIFPGYVSLPEGSRNNNEVSNWPVGPVYLDGNDLTLWRFFWKRIYAMIFETRDPSEKVGQFL